MSALDVHIPLAANSGSSNHEKVPTPAKLTSKKWVLGALFSALAADLLWYQAAPGLGMAIWLMGSLLALTSIRSRQKGWWWPVVALALISLRLTWEFSWGAMLMGVPLWFMALSGGRVNLLRIPEALVAFPSALISRAAHLFLLPRIVLSSGNLKNLTSSLASMRWPLFGWLASIFLGIVFLSIFRMGNPILDLWMVKLENVVTGWERDFLNTFEAVPSHLLFILFMVWMSVVALLPKVRANIWRRACTVTGSSFAELWPQGMSRKTFAFKCLLILNVVTLAPNLLDLGVLWFGQELPEGVKYVTYAHEGVAWLTFSVLAATAVLALLVPSRFSTLSSGIRVLGWLYIGQNLFMGLGSFRRLQLYVDFNGLTILRVIGFVGIFAVLACLLVVVLAKFKEKDGLWVLRTQTAIMSSLIFLLVALPMDNSIAKFNVQRILNGMERPSVQLLAQPWGPSACVALLPLLEGENTLIRRGTAALLLTRLEDFKKDLHTQNQDWRSWTYSLDSSVQRLEEKRSQMAYEVGRIPLETHLNDLRRFSRDWY